MDVHGWSSAIYTITAKEVGVEAEGRQEVLLLEICYDESRERVDLLARTDWLLALM